METTTCGNEGKLISSKEARKLLGKTAEGMSDETLMRVVRLMYYLSTTLLAHFQFHKNLQKGVK